MENFIKIFGFKILLIIVVLIGSWIIGRKVTTNKKIVIGVLLLINLYNIVPTAVFITLEYQSLKRDYHNQVIVEVNFQNESGKVLDDLYISSIGSPVLEKVDTIKIDEKITSSFYTYFKIQGAAALVFIDSEGIEHSESLIGYLMPHNEVSVKIISADTGGFVIETVVEN